MIIIRSLNSIKKPLPKIATTIGNFDGVHLGHLEIIKQLKNIAQENSCKTAIITFEPHPINFFKPQNSKNFRINSLAQKLRIFKNLEIDYVIILKFNKKFSEISAQDFVEEILIKNLNILSLTIGYDFTFGKNRQGSFDFLQNYSDKKVFKLNQVSKFKKDEQICSSSFIRKLLADGKISQANELLANNFTISSIVNEGNKLGRTIGFPTINLKLRNDIVMPKFGVYKSKTFVHHLNKTFDSITNFGIKPSIKGNNSPIFETYIFNFSDILYGKKVSIKLLKFIREEKKFNNLDELKAQIKSDIEQK